MLGSENNNADELIISIQVIINAKKLLLPGKTWNRHFSTNIYLFFLFEKWRLFFDHYSDHAWTRCAVARFLSEGTLAPKFVKFMKQS